MLDKVRKLLVYGLLSLQNHDFLLIRTTFSSGMSQETVFPFPVVPKPEPFSTVEIRRGRGENADLYSRLALK